MASGSGDGSIRVWDVGTGAHDATLAGHSEEVTALVVIWEFALKRYPKIFSHILRYPKISLNWKKSKDKLYGYERISLTG